MYPWRLAFFLRVFAKTSWSQALIFIIQQLLCIILDTDVGGKKKSAMRFCDNRFALVQFYNLNVHTTWMVQKTYKPRLCVQWARAGVCPNACKSKRQSPLEEQSFNSRSQRTSTDKFPSSMNGQSKIKSTHEVKASWEKAGRNEQQKWTCKLTHTYPLLPEATETKCNHSCVTVQLF